MLVALRLIAWFAVLERASALESPSKAALPLRPHQFARFFAEGLVLLPNFFTQEEVQACHRYLDTVLWSEDRARRPRLTIEASAPGTYRPSRRYLLPRAPASMRNGSYKLTLRVQEIGTTNPIHRLILNRRLVASATALMPGRAPIKTLPRQGGLIFERGTQQGLHVDTWYGLAGGRPGGMVAAWIALDTADEDNGALQYVPGSHRWLEANFTASAERWWRMTAESGEQHDEVYRQAALQQPVILARASPGDVILWHERLLHGGARVRDWSRTRLSIATHYADRVHHFFG